MPTGFGEVLNESDIYEEWAPPQRWHGVVECVWEQRLVADRVQRVIPDGCADLLIDGQGRLTVVGLYDEVDLPWLTAGTHIRGIRFRPEVVGAAFGAPAWMLKNSSFPLEDVMTSKQAGALTEISGRQAWLDSLEPSPRAGSVSDWSDATLAYIESNEGFLP